ncbi:hypothetical protein [Bilophila wadsworthia]|uniref:hypothetical protein n=1 Tax=Bilophila wadsworthia TaxID=35833 RepID=UPI003AB51400
MKRYQIETSGKKCVVLGRSNIVGKPMAALMMQKAYPLSPSNLSYCNSLPSASLTRAGLALPFILRMTCPTKKLMSLVLPPL